jgi:hypothetical protein
MERSTGIYRVWLRQADKELWEPPREGFVISAYASKRPAFEHRTSVLKSRMSHRRADPKPERAALRIDLNICILDLA